MNRRHSPNDEYFAEDRDGCMVGAPCPLDDVSSFRIWYSAYEDIPKNLIESVPYEGLLWFFLRDRDAAWLL